MTRPDETELRRQPAPERPVDFDFEFEAGLGGARSLAPEGDGFTQLPTALPALLTLWAPSQVFVEVNEFQFGFAGTSTSATCDTGLHAEQTPEGLITALVARARALAAAQPPGPWRLGGLASRGQGWQRVALPPGVTGLDGLSLREEDGHPLPCDWRPAPPVGGQPTAWLSVPGGLGGWSVDATVDTDASLRLSTRFGALNTGWIRAAATPILGATLSAWRSAQHQLWRHALEPLLAQGWQLSGRLWPEPLTPLDAAEIERRLTEPAPDFERTLVEGFDFSGRALANASLREARFVGCRFTGATLDGADLAHAELVDCDLAGSTTHGAVLPAACTVAPRPPEPGELEARLARPQPDLSGLRLDGADLSGRDLSGLRVVGADLRGCTFAGSQLARAHFEGGALIGCTFAGASLYQARFVGADLTHADFTHARLVETRFERCTLTGAQLRDAERHDVVFSGAQPDDVSKQLADYANALRPLLASGAPTLRRAALSQSDDGLVLHVVGEAELDALLARFVADQPSPITVAVRHDAEGARLVFDRDAATFDFDLAHGLQAAGTLLLDEPDADAPLLAAAERLLQLVAPAQLAFSLDAFEYGHAGSTYGLSPAVEQAVEPLITEGADAGQVVALVGQMAQRAAQGQTQAGPWRLSGLRALEPTWLRVALPAGIERLDSLTLRLEGGFTPADCRVRPAAPLAGLNTVWLHVGALTGGWQLAALDGQTAQLRLSTHFGALLHELDPRPSATAICGATLYAWQAAQAVLWADVLGPLRAAGWQFEGLPGPLPGPVSAHGQADRPLLRATHPAALFAGGLRSADAAPTESGLRPSLVSEGALVCAEQLAAGGTPREGLDLCLIAFDRAREENPDTWTPAANRRLHTQLEVQTGGFPALARWMHALRDAVHTAADLPAAVRFLERARHTWTMTTALRVPPSEVPPLTLAGEPVRRATLAQAVARFNQQRRAQRGDTPDALNSRMLDPLEVAAFVDALPQMPDEVRALAAQRPIELGAPGLKLFAFDGFGLRALAAGFALERTEQSWRIAPEYHHADLGADLALALDLRRRWQAADPDALPFGDVARARGNAARLALAAVRRARTAMQGAFWNSVPVDSARLGDADLAGLESELAAEVSAAPPTTSMLGSRGPRYRYPPGLAPEGVPAEAPEAPRADFTVGASTPTPRRTAPATPSPFGQRNASISFEDPFAAATPTPPPVLPTAPSALDAGQVYTVELGKSARFGRPQLPLARLLLNDADEIECVALAPNGARIADDVLAHGVPDYSGQKTVTSAADPLAFLGLLEEAFRGRYYASKITALSAATARQGWDHTRPMPELVIEQVRPFQRVLDVWHGRETLTLGVGAGVDTALNAEPAFEGARITLRWHNGWLWIAPAGGPAGFRLDGMPVAAINPERPSPVDPGAELTIGERAVRLRW